MAYAMNRVSNSTCPPRAREQYIPNPKLRFLDQCREVLRFRQMADRTEQTYVDWIRRFIVWARDHSQSTPATGNESTPHPGPLPGRGGEGSGAEREKRWRHPREMGAAEVRGFLTHLAVERNVAAATQNQALNALVFLYREIIGGELEWLGGFEPAKRGARLPEVLSRQEAQAVLAQLKGTHALIGRLLYGTGLRLMEGLRLRVKDIDFARGQIVVRAGKGDRDRVTMLPEALREALKAHLHRHRQRRPTRRCRSTWPRNLP